MDVFTDSRKYIPGVGNYENADKPWLVCSSNLRTPKFKRGR